MEMVQDGKDPMLSICIFIHRCVPPAYSRPGHEGSSLYAMVPRLPLFLAITLRLFRMNSEAFPSLWRDTVPPGCPGSAIYQPVSVFRLATACVELLRVENVRLTLKHLTLVSFQLIRSHSLAGLWVISL